MEERTESNDGIVRTFLGSVNGILSKYFEEASQIIESQGLSEREAAILKIEKTIDASIEIRSQAESIGSQVVNGLPDSAKTTRYFSQLVVELDNLIEITPERLQLVKDGVIELNLAQVKIVDGQALRILSEIGNATDKAFAIFEMLAIVGAVLDKDYHDAAFSSIGSLVGLSVGAIVLGTLGPVSFSATIAAAVGTGVGLLTTAVLEAVIGEEEFELFIQSVTDVVSDLVANNLVLDNGQDLNMGNDLLHQFLINRIDNAVFPEQSDNILEAISGKHSQGAEQLLKSLERLITGTTNPTPIEDNDAYFNRVLNLFSAIGDEPLGQLQFIEDPDLDLVKQALQDDTQGMATRYALQELNPFILGTTDDTIYADHNQNGELDLNNFSEDYLYDRAAMLRALTRLNLTNSDGYSGTIREAELGLYSDLTLPDQEIWIADDQVRLNKSFLDSERMRQKHIIFGSDEPDNIEGGDVSDRLYGRAGIDTLQGGLGNDFLEGGSGDDSYIFNTGDGVDVIYDSQGANQLLIDGNEVGTLVAVGKPDSGVFQEVNANGEPASETVFKLIGDDLHVYVNGIGSGDRIEIESFRDDSSNFGFELPEAQQPSLDPVALVETANGSNSLYDFNSAIAAADPDYRISKPSASYPVGLNFRYLYSHLSLDDYTPGTTVVVDMNQMLRDMEYDNLGYDFYLQYHGASGGLSDLELRSDVVFGRHAEGSLKEEFIGTGLGDDVIYAQAGFDRVLAGGYNDGSVYRETTSFGDGSSEAYLQAITDDDFVDGGDGMDILFGDALVIYDSLQDNYYSSFFDPRPGLDTSGQRLRSDLLSQTYLDEPVDNGKDIILGGDNSAHIFGDMISSGGGDDIIVAGHAAGYNTLAAGAGSDLVTGGDGADRIFADGVGLQILNYDGSVFNAVDNPWRLTHQSLDYSVGFLDAQYTTGAIVGYNDQVTGGAGNDFIAGEIGDDELMGEEGDDLLMGDRVNDASLYTETEQLTYSNLDIAAHGDDRLFGNAGADQLFGNGGNDSLFGGDGNDILYGDDDSLDLEHHGNDLLMGGSGDDHLFGNGGNDLLDGGSGSNHYYFEGAFGHDVIRLGEAGSDDENRIHLGEGVAAETITLTRSGESLLMSLDEDSIEIRDFFVSADLRLSVGFADGTQWTTTDILAEFPPESDDAVDDEISDPMVGTEGNDTLLGGTGNDRMEGGAGDDRFIVEGYDQGFDRIIGGEGIDTLLGGEGDDRFGLKRLTIADSLEIIDGGSGSNRISGNGRDNRLNFSATELISIERIDGRGGDDVIFGSQQADLIHGGSGNDKLVGNGGADTLKGASGDDSLLGSEGDDRLIGGIGNDRLLGGAGNDKYIFRRGDGDDVVILDPEEEGRDKIIYRDVGSDELWFQKTGNNLLISTIGSDDSVKIKNWFSDADQHKIIAADASLENSALLQLINAMAAFDVPDGTGYVLPPDTRDALEPQLAAAWS